MAELLIFAAAGTLLLVALGVVIYAMMRPAKFFADASCVRMVASFRGPNVNDSPTYPRPPAPPRPVGVNTSSQPHQENPQ